VDTASTRHLVGIPFTSQVRTLPMERYSVKQGHTSIKSFSKVGVRLLYSSAPNLSVESAEREVLPAQQAIGSTAAPNPRNYTYEKQVLGPHNITGQITATTDSLWALTITAIFGKAELSDV
jgi:hypothetical protein